MLNFKNIISCPLTPLPNETSYPQKREIARSSNPSMSKSQCFSFSLLWLSSWQLQNEWRGVHGNVFVLITHLNLPKDWAIFIMCLSGLYLSMKFISRHMKMELLIHVTVCAIQEKMWFCWIVSLEMISNTMDNWERKIQWLHPWAG